MSSCSFFINVFVLMRIHGGPEVGFQLENCFYIFGVTFLILQTKNIFYSTNLTWICFFSFSSCLQQFSSFCSIKLIFGLS